MRNFKITAFRWNPTKRTLHLKRTLPWGNLPFEIWVQGKHNRVKFVHSKNNDSKRHAFYKFSDVAGPPNPHMNETTQIQLVIPWR
jgi:hypothetical protein